MRETIERRICDRCGQTIYDDEKRKVFLRAFNRAGAKFAMLDEFLENVVDEYGGFTVCEYDMCPECNRQFDKWFAAGKKEKNKTRENEG
ncbi:MAG: hypothetical protein IKV56_02170 [Kiritimatiellae bacterium]|nr:hypothetical protein [Kiritimatiellia bacterium]